MEMYDRSLRESDNYCGVRTIKNVGCCLEEEKEERKKGDDRRNMLIVDVLRERLLDWVSVGKQRGLVFYSFTTPLTTERKRLTQSTHSFPLFLHLFLQVFPLA